MELQGNPGNNNLEKSIQQLLTKYQLEDVFFGLYCYANKQAQQAKSTNNNPEKIQWEKLVNILDEACDLVEEGKGISDNNDSYLIY